MGDTQNPLDDLRNLVRLLQEQGISISQLRALLELARRESKADISNEALEKVLTLSSETTEESDVLVGSAEIGRAKPEQIIAKAQRTLRESNQTLPQDLVVLVGLLGDSPRGNNYMRLYLTLQLNDYVEFSIDDVVLHETVGISPLGGKIVWLRQGATIERVRIESLQVQKGFFQGDISVNNVSLFSGSNMEQGFASGAGSFHCGGGGGSFHCGGGSFHCGGGSFHCGGGSFHCGGGSFHCGGGSFHCGGGSFHCGGG